MKNDWNRFFNGGTSQYNFSYRSEASPVPETAPSSLPSVPVASVSVPLSKVPNNQVLPNNSISKTKNHKENKVVIPTIKGGKRRTRRGKSSRNSRNSKRKQSRRK